MGGVDRRLRAMWRGIASASVVVLLMTGLAGCGASSSYPRPNIQVGEEPASAVPPARASTANSLATREAPIADLYIDPASLRVRPVNPSDGLPQHAVTEFSYGGNLVGGLLSVLRGTGLGLVVIDQEAAQQPVNVRRLTGTIADIVPRLCEAAGVWCAVRQGAVEIRERELLIADLPPSLSDASDAAAPDIRQTLKLMLGTGEAVEDKGGNALLFRATVEEARRVQAYLDTIRSTGAVLLYDFWIAEVSLNEKHSRGIRWKDLAAKIGSAQIGFSGGPGALAANAVGIRGLYDGGGATIDAVIEALDEAGAVHVLSSPTLSLASGTSAIFETSDTRGYVSEVSIPFSAGGVVPGGTSGGVVGTGIALSQTKSEKLITGLTLEVQGQFYSGMVFTRFKVKDDQFVRFDSVATSGTTIQQPNTRGRKIGNMIPIRPGEVLVAAGTKQARTEVSEEGVGGSGEKGVRLPSSSREITENVELVIMISPRVLRYSVGPKPAEAEATIPGMMPSGFEPEAPPARIQTFPLPVPAEGPPSAPGEAPAPAAAPVVPTVTSEVLAPIPTVRRSPPLRGKLRQSPDRSPEGALAAVVAKTTQTSSAANPRASTANAQSGQGHGQLVLASWTAPALARPPTVDPDRIAGPLAPSSSGGWLSKLLAAGSDAKRKLTAAARHLTAVFRGHDLWKGGGALQLVSEARAEARTSSLSPPAWTRPPEAAASPASGAATVPQPASVPPPVGQQVTALEPMISLGPITIGRSAPFLITIRNGGAATVGFGPTALHLGSGAVADLAVVDDGCKGQELRPGTSCTVLASVTATERGSVRVLAVSPHNGPERITKTEIAGEADTAASRPRASVDPPRDLVSDGDCTPAAGKAACVLLNRWDRDITVTGIDAIGDVAVERDDCSRRPLPAGARCAVVLSVQGVGGAATLLAHHNGPTMLVRIPLADRPDGRSAGGQAAALLAAANSNVPSAAVSPAPAPANEIHAGGRIALGPVRVVGVSVSPAWAMLEISGEQRVVARGDKLQLPSGNWQLAEVDADGVEIVNGSLRERLDIDQFMRVLPKDKQATTSTVAAEP